MAEKTYIDWRGTDQLLLEKYRNANTLTTVNGDTLNPVPQTTPILPEEE